MKKYNANAARLKDYTQYYFKGEKTVDAKQREELIIKYTPLIKYLAGKLAMRLPAHISMDDLVSSGTIGLIDAINKFDPGKNIQFKTYAEFRIRGAMLDELRSLDWVPRSVRRKIADIEKAYNALQKERGRPAEDEEVADRLGLSLADFYHLIDTVKGVSLTDLNIIRRRTSEDSDDDFFEIVADGRQSDPFVSLGLAQLRDIIAGAIDELPEKERLVVSLYYYEDLTMREIGEIMGYTESRISQMHTKATLRLRGALLGHFDRGA
ncbi:MAG: FliA/WhiG family RNA polymerase sigma factor [Thermodesulfobacteriota bacterium]|nr:FliA/WhiG family RNA polymerase sigma factor [Thermodesulfobacteriota bacterium]